MEPGRILLERLAPEPPRPRGAARGGSRRAQRSLSDRWSVFLRWVFATAAGTTIGTAILVAAASWATKGLAAPPSRLELARAVAALVLAGGAAGCALGAPQAAVLSRRFGLSFARWTASTAVAGAAAVCAATAVATVAGAIVRPGADPAMVQAGLLSGELTLLGAFVGVVLGIGQLGVLHPRFRETGLWVLASAAAWGVGLNIAFTGATFLPDGGVTVPFLLIGAAVSLSTGLAVGAITGFALLSIAARERSVVL